MTAWGKPTPKSSLLAAAFAMGSVLLLGSCASVAPDDPPAYAPLRVPCKVRTVVPQMSGYIWTDATYFVCNDGRVLVQI